MPVHPKQINLDVIGDEPYQIGSGGVSPRDLVYFSSDDTVDKADASVESKMPGIGFVVAVDSPVPGQCTVRRSGTLGGFAGLVKQKVYYSDPTTPGGITGTPPTGDSNKVAQEVAIGINTTEIAITLDADYTVL
jgi:hypothetical protein